MKVTGSISKYDFFIRSIASNVHLRREWMLRTFTVVMSEVIPSTPWLLFHDKENGTVNTLDNNGTWLSLEGVKYLQIPFIYHEIVPLVKIGDIANALFDVKNSTWGEMLFNARTVSYAYGQKIPYMQHPIELGKLGDYLGKYTVSDPEDGVFEDTKIYVKELRKFNDAVSDIATYEFFIPSIDRVAITVPPDNNSLKDQLFEKYKDQLDDPIIQIKIQDELVANYKDRLKGNPSEGFLYSNKSINSAIKRMLLIHGTEHGFAGSGRPVLLKNSLDEGMDINHFPEEVNSLRNGAYSRGALTAEAGADVDLLARIYQNAKIHSEFCGTKLTFPMYVNTGHNGRNINYKGKILNLTDENINEHLGDIREFYSPLYCNKERMDVCTVCIGRQLSEYMDALSTNVTAITSSLMDKMMGSAHAKEQKTTELSTGWLN